MSAMDLMRISPSTARMVWVPLTNTVVWSDAFYKLHGLRRGVDPVEFDTFLHLAHPDERTALERVVGDSLRRMEPFAVLHRILDPQGEERLVEARGNFIVDDVGNLERFELDVSYAD